MSKKQQAELSSLGAILIQWGVITHEQLQQALNDQITLRGDDLLGRLLIARGACSAEDIQAAVEAQTSLREVGKHKSAMAVADLALARKRRDSLIVRRDRVIRKGDQVAKTITGDDHPAITQAMLAKPTGD